MMRERRREEGKVKRQKVGGKGEKKLTRIRNL
jgi:hypothetical protein